VFHYTPSKVEHSPSKNDVLGREAFPLGDFSNKISTLKLPV